MVSTVRKLGVLIYKSLLLRWRNWLLTILDLAAPIGVIYLAYYLNSKISSESHSQRERFDVHPPLTTEHFRSVDNLEIVYSPTNEFTDKIMNILHNKNSDWCKLTKTNDEDELLQQLLTVNSSRRKTGIVFTDVNQENNIYKYKIRTYSKYKDDFIPIQVNLDKALINSTGAVLQENTFFGLIPRYIPISELFFLFIYLFMMIAYVFLVVSTVRDVIQEKASGIKEYMKIMGISSWMIWTHWLLYTFIVHLPVSIVNTIILTVLSPPVIPANFIIVWLLFFLFTCTCVILLFVLTCIFQSVFLGTSLCVSAWLVVHIFSIQYLLEVNNLGLYMQILFTLLPLNNLIMTLHSLTSFRDNGIIWTLEYMFTKGFTGSYISVGLSMIIFVLEIIILSFILAFLDGIRPGPYGVAKPINFFCQWCISLCKQRDDTSEIITDLPKGFEPPPRTAKVGIKIRGLHKRFGLFNKFVAVEKIDLDIYEGEIMALLGHNGAGKTTTMSIITGMFSATEGVILFDGVDTRRNQDYRSSLGLCTQHNLYFPKFTVIEHLVFFGMLRGMSHSEAKRNGLNVLQSLNLYNKSKSHVSSLSGGMKRRLCLAVSLVGNPKVLILDEPTSGLDPESRRQIWDIILGMRGQRTILITTHFMEEADVLGDRIAIMDHGLVICCGTTMFLKKLYGTGYCLHVLKKQNTQPEIIFNIVLQYVPNSNMKVISPNQIDFDIKKTFVDKFPDLFAALEENKNSLGITGISVTCTTMEEVFLNAAQNISDGKAITDDQKSLPDDNPGSDSDSQYSGTEGFKLCIQRFKTLLWKRLLLRCRNKIFFVFTIIIICLMVYFLMKNTVVSNVESEEKSAPLFLTLDMYPDSISFIQYDDEERKISEIAKNFVESHKSKSMIISNNLNMTKYIMDLADKDTSKYFQILLAMQFFKGTFIMQYNPLAREYVLPIAINAMFNILLRNSTADNSGSIEVVSHPYTVTADEHCEAGIFYGAITPIFWLFIFSFCLLILMMDFVLLPTEERVCGFKNLQYIAGVSPHLYWFSHFIFDFCIYLCISFLFLIITSIVGGEIFLSSDCLSLLILVLILCGASGIFFVYCFTFLIDGTVLSSSIFLMGNLFFCMIPALVLKFNVFKNLTHHILIMMLFSINPFFAVSSSIHSIGTCVSNSYLCKVCNNTQACESCNKSLFIMPKENELNGILLQVLFLFIDIIVYIAILLFIDCGFVREIWLILFHKPPLSLVDNEDDDVRKENENIKSLKAQNGIDSPLMVHGLLKKYCLGPTAVNNVSFMVRPGDCFGLLGVNGAGKTTTFKIITGEIVPNRGDASIFENSLILNKQKYLAGVGYCPQVEAFMENLTSKETLTIFALIKGISKEYVKKEVRTWLKTMGIPEFSNKLSGTYSGGTKRKLSTAMAFIGNPDVVFLDEPTTGVDPESRRKLWNVMQKQQKTGQAIVLTSHSMEECEALCTRLTIMRDGQMKCIGTPEYLKNKFSQGYTILVKLINPTTNALNSFKSEFQNIFKNVEIKDEHSGLINYQISDPNVRLSRLFTVMLQLKNKHAFIEDFSVSNTTLEQIFMSFTKKKSRRN